MNHNVANVAEQQSQPKNESKATHPATRKVVQEELGVKGNGVMHCIVSNDSLGCSGGRH